MNKYWCISKVLQILWIQQYSILKHFYIYTIVIIIMNRRKKKATAALLLFRRKKYNRRYWVHPINQTRKDFGEFHTLYKDLRKYPDRFYTYYRMSTEQFDTILAQIQHLIYKPNSKWWRSISLEEKLAICIRYEILYFL